MPSHPKIPSVYEVCHDTQAILEFPENIHGFDTTRGIEEDDDVTHDDIQYARNVVSAVREYFGSLPLTPEQKGKAVSAAERYKVEVESAFDNTRVPPPISQMEIQALRSKIQELELKIGEGSGHGHGPLAGRIDSVQSTANSAQSAAEKAQSAAENVQIAAENAQIALRNRHRQYCTEEFRALKKVALGSGFELANAVRLKNEKSSNDTITTIAQDAAEVGSTPPNFKGQIAKYSHEDILKMIVFYNNHFGIIHSDALQARINKFESFLSGYGEM